MMLPKMIRNVALLATLSLGASQANAAFMGSFPLAGIGTTANTNSIGTATVYTFTGGLQTTNVGLGNFAPPSPGVPSGATFTATPLTIGGTTFSFTNATYGTFTETVAPVMGATTIVGGNVVAQAYYILGTYVGGAVGVTPISASITLSFTQDGGPNNSVSSSGSLLAPAGPPPGVPEPASMTLMGLGLVGAGAIARRRNKSQASA